MAARSDTAPQEIPRAEPVETLGGRVALRYVARAGLLPELSRQTYDSFPKALREAVLNSSTPTQHGSTSTSHVWRAITS